MNLFKVSDDDVELDEVEDLHTKLNTDNKENLRPADNQHIISVGELSTHIYVDETTPPINESKTGIHEVKEKFEWRILRIPKFILIIFSVVIFHLGISVIYTCVPALGEESGE